MPYHKNPQTDPERTLVWDVIGMVYHFGGPKRMGDLAKAYGVPGISDAAGHTWTKREHLSSESLLGLIELGMAIGKPLIVNDFAVTQQEYLTKRQHRRSEVAKRNEPKRGRPIKNV